MAPFNEVREKAHHTQVVFAVAAPPSERHVFSWSNTSVVGGAGGARRRGAERVQQSLVCQRRQAALQVQEVGGAAADAHVGVGQSADQHAGVGRRAQRLLVQVQQGQIATVASQRVKHSGRGARGQPEQRQRQRSHRVVEEQREVGREVGRESCRRVGYR